MVRTGLRISRRPTCSRLRHWRENDLSQALFFRQGYGSCWKNGCEPFYSERGVNLDDVVESGIEMVSESEKDCVLSGSWRGIEAWREEVEIGTST